jgi:hypothetical protein
MPKRVKKKPATDPNRRAHQLLNQHLDKLSEGQWAAETADPAAPQGDPFKAQLSAYMSKLGAKGGKVSGAKRMEMPERLRKSIAKKGAAARWAKKKRPAQS